MSELLDQIIISMFVGIVGFLLHILWRRGRAKEPIRWWQTFLMLLLWVYSCMVVSVTLFPLFAEDPFHRDIAEAVNIVPFVSIIEDMRHIGSVYEDHALFMMKHILRNVGGNILLLMPLGFLVPFLLKRRFRLIKVLLIGIAVSLGIEILQLVEMMTGLSHIRATDIDDVICNVFGAVLGYIIYVIVAKISKV